MAATSAMEMATNLRRSFRIMGRTSFVEKSVEKVEKC